MAAFSRVGAAMRRCSLAGAAFFTGFGGAACTGLGSGFFSTGLSRAAAAASPRSHPAASRAASRSPCRVSGSRPSRRPASARPAPAAARARRRSRRSSALRASSSVLGLLGLLLRRGLLLGDLDGLLLLGRLRLGLRDLGRLFLGRGGRLHLALARRGRDAGRRGRAEHDLDRHHLEPDAVERRLLVQQKQREQPAVNEPARTPRRRPVARATARRAGRRARSVGSTTSGASRASLARGRTNGTTLLRSAADATAPRARERPRRGH